jgi:hypothetical protein
VHHGASRGVRGCESGAWLTGVELGVSGGHGQRGGSLLLAGRRRRVARPANPMLRGAGGGAGAAALAVAVAAVEERSNARAREAVPVACGEAWSPGFTWARSNLVYLGNSIGPKLGPCFLL